MYALMHIYIHIHIYLYIFKTSSFNTAGLIQCPLLHLSIFIPLFSSVRNLTPINLNIFTVESVPLNVTYLPAAPS